MTFSESVHHDDVLVAGVRCGDPDACAGFIRRHGPAMLRTCQRLAGSGRAVAAVNDALQAAFDAIERDGATMPLAPWLRRVAIRAALRARPSDAGEAALAELLPRWEDDGHRAGVRPAWPPQNGNAAANVGKARDGIDRLPDDHRVIMVLHDGEGLTPDEIAGLLGMAPAIVKRRLHRARMAVREVLDQEVAPQ